MSMPFPNRSDESEEKDQYDHVEHHAITALPNIKPPSFTRGFFAKQKHITPSASGQVVSTPPPSRQRRHSKMHLRVSSELSVDQTGTSSSGLCKDRYRIVMLGSSAVGKTAIVEQFLYGSFTAGHAATVEELHKGEYDVPELGVLPIEILDTSGSYEFPAMRRLAITTGDVFAIVYAIDNVESFDDVKIQRETILQVKGSEDPPPIVVVGNKIDLPEDKRCVQLELAECFCIDWDCGFVECSAKNNENIGTIYSSLLIQARLKGIFSKNPMSNISKPSGGETKPHSQRRRSSLPISELFHNRHSGLNLHSKSNNPIRKRSSCTPS